MEGDFFVVFQTLGPLSAITVLALQASGSIGPAGSWRRPFTLGKNQESGPSTGGSTSTEGRPSHACGKGSDFNGATRSVRRVKLCSIVLESMSATCTR